MTEELLTELERLASQAIPGPWIHEPDENFFDHDCQIIKGDTAFVCEFVTEKNAAYIVAACNMLPDFIAENRALQERVRELEELCGNLNREVVNLMGSFPVTDCRICDYSYWCTREKTQIDPDFDMCKAAILEFCKPDSEEAGE